MIPPSIAPSSGPPGDLTAPIVPPGADPRIVTVEDLGGQPLAGSTIAPGAPAAAAPAGPEPDAAPRGSKPERRPDRSSTSRKARRLKRAAIGVSILAVGCLGLWLGLGLDHRYGDTPPAVVVNIGGPPGTGVGQPGSSVPFFDEADADAGANVVIEMPDVLGLDETAAREALADAGVDNADVTLTDLPFVGPAGRIVKQSPTRRTTNPGQVQLWKSVAATMPDVVGKQMTEATTALEAIGVRVVKTDRYAPGAVKGAVLQTDLPAGQPLGDQLGRQINVFVATDPAQVYLDQVSAIASACSAVSSQSSSTPVRVYGDVVAHGVSCSVSYSPSSSSPPSERADVNEYDIARKADFFEAKVGLSDSSPSSGRVRFEVWAGSEQLAAADVAAGEAPKPIAVNVSGRLKLTLRTYATSGSPSSSSSSSTTAVWVEPKLSGSPGQIDELAAKKP